MDKKLLFVKLENVMSAIKDLNSIKDDLPPVAKQKLIPLRNAYIEIKPEFEKLRNKINKEEVVAS